MRVKRGEVRTRFVLLALMVLLAAPVAACSGGGSDDGLEPLSIAASSTGKTAKLRVEIADEPAELTKGLSGRQTLAQDAGMLFLIQQRGGGFWMKDTFIPLSLAFIDVCGRIVAMTDMQPESTQLHVSPYDYRFALEVNQGWFNKNGVNVGDQVTIPKSLKQPDCV